MSDREHPGRELRRPIRLELRQHAQELGEQFLGPIVDLFARSSAAQKRVKRPHIAQQKCFLCGAVALPGAFNDGAFEFNQGRHRYTNSERRGSLERNPLKRGWIGSAAGATLRETEP